MLSYVRNNGVPGYCRLDRLRFAMPMTMRHASQDVKLCHVVDVNRP